MAAPDMDRLASHAIPHVAAKASPGADDVLYGPILTCEGIGLTSRRFGELGSEAPQGTFPNTGPGQSPTHASESSKPVVSAKGVHRHRLA